MGNGVTQPESSKVAWSDLGRIVAAHVVMLRDAAILDDPAAAALLAALDGVARGEPPAGVTPSSLIGAFDQRLDALTPPGAVGAAAVGRGNADVLAAVLRLSLRDRLLTLAGMLNAMRQTVIDFATEHATTLMPAYSAGQAAQPTTLAHFLGGLIAPLGHAAESLRVVFGQVSRSPLGALSLASTSLEIDREGVAQLLAFDGLVVNTFDAVSSVDQVTDTAEVAAAIAAAIRRFLEEVLAWLRTEPGSFRLGEAWTSADPGLPQTRPPTGVERLIALARTAEGDAATLIGQARAAPYGPVGAPTADTLYDLSGRVLHAVTDLASGTREFIGGGLEPNRAYLANRAGKAHTTSSDLADFLMIEEQLDPAAARGIAALTIRKAIADGIEVGGITPEMIDAAALVVIGRELRVEIENISRHLAPRRFIERRTAPGSPSPTATRAYLDLERSRLAAGVRWHADTLHRLDTARADLDRLVAELIETATEGGG